MAISIRLPPKIKVTLAKGQEPSDLMAQVILSAYSKSMPQINAMLKEPENWTAACKNDENQEKLFENIFHRIAVSYLDSTTNIAWANNEMDCIDPEARDNPQQPLSGALSNLSDLVGKRSAQQIYMLLAASIDKALEEKTGAQRAPNKSR